MYRIAICDDDSLQVSNLENQISRYFDELNIQYEIDGYYKGDRLVKSMREQMDNYQLIFLDIEMEIINGIETAKLLRNLDKNFILIYVTSYEQYALESFEVSPFRYLIKPVSLEKLKVVLSDVLVELTAKQKFLFYQVGMEHFQVILDNIVCLYSEFGRKIHLELVDDSSVSFYGKISIIEEELPQTHFVRVNSGTIINLDYVASFNRNDVTMVNGDCITVSRSRKKAVVAAYNQFIERSFGL
ncbi:response regulator [Streptococcus anginosus]|uniref:LytR/AlgR family response regulator transcription factor n=1 Tax=Streptococcus anginosus TaxID=1328 RepID=UPI000D02481E|nr:LytTR family DNA-binding domain-containing protein [Streptococcus anginosus]MCW1035316.1 LytTR family DNA-binding domain-containing protein [Streptococcus anginosus]PRT75075.1 DNA-binding response regulator [Streptococcus anginosus]VTS43630.1 response regulator [Streptococcus anginosus]